MIFRKSLMLLSLMLIISGCTEKAIEPSNILEITSSNGKVQVNVEIADTPSEIQTGLMYRDRLGRSSGMLFVFGDEAKRSFWMKNTKIPLDMMFIYENGTIQEIKKNVQPCLEDPCSSYPSKYPSKYVLEVNSGFSERNGIEVGDRIETVN